MMNSSRLFFTRASLSYISQQPLFFSPVRPVSCSVGSTQTRTPLHLKPPSFHATLSELKKWHKWAKNQASSSSSSKSSDLDPTLLLRELNWLVEDTMQNHQIINHNSSIHDDVTNVSLRACLDDLYHLWNQRIQHRRPFQYIVGCEHWRDLILAVQEGVLIPRPETEMIVDLVDDAMKKNGELKSGIWADLGTGSGALAIGISRILENRGKVVATDLSQVAVDVASYNVQRYNLQDRISVRQGSWFDPLVDFHGELSGVVSNPPYIPSEDIDGLQAEVCNHEPKLALDGGKNGMKDLICICDGAAYMLKPGGFFAFETNGEMQCKFLVDYMDTKMKGSFDSLKIVSDFAGIQRFVTGYRGI